MSKQYTNLTATNSTSGWYIDDIDGGRWIPSEEAEQEIEASADPAMTAKRICDEEPMRGAWRQ